jgi:hypothetical protein
VWGRGFLLSQGEAVSNLEEQSGGSRRPSPRHARPTGDVWLTEAIAALTQFLELEQSKWKQEHFDLAFRREVASRLAPNFHRRLLVLEVRQDRVLLDADRVRREATEVCRRHGGVREEMWLRRRQRTQEDVSDESFALVAEMRFAAKVCSVEDDLRRLAIFRGPMASRVIISTVSMDFSAESEETSAVVESYLKHLLLSRNKTKLENVLTDIFHSCVFASEDLTGKKPVHIVLYGEYSVSEFQKAWIRAARFCSLHDTS